MKDSRVRGTATTKANVVGVLVPAVNGAIVDICLAGQTTTRTVAQQRKVYVNTIGSTQLSASKRLYLSPEWISTAPAVANASTRQQTCGVCVDRRSGRRLIGRIAQRRAAESRPRAEGEQTMEARTTISSRMDEQVAEMISKTNSQLQQDLESVESQ